MCILLLLEKVVGGRGCGGGVQDNTNNLVKKTNPNHPNWVNVFSIAKF